MVTKAMIDENMELIKECDILIMQLEIPFETVSYVKELAVKNKKLVIVDPAPAIPNMPDDFWNGIDYIKPNETELSILTGMQTDNKEELLSAASVLVNKGVKNVIVTLGEEGCMLINKDLEKIFESYKVKAVDTTAAGDSFMAAFALALSKGKTVFEAIQFGQKVSAIAVTRKGAQASVPTIEDVEKFM